MTQLALDACDIPTNGITADVTPQAHQLCTYSVFDADGVKVFHARCSCSWRGPDVASGPTAAGTWMKHTELARLRADVA